MRRLSKVASEFLKRLRSGRNAAAYVVARALGAKPKPSATAAQSESSLDRTLRAELRAVAACEEAGEWQEASHRADRAAALAWQSSNTTLVRKAARELMRREAYGRGWALRAAAGGPSRASSVPPEWDGADLSGKALLIENRYPDIGPQFRVARLIGPAAARARHCIVATEKRLVPLLQRTFPTARVRSENEDLTQDLRAVDAVASYATLGRYFTPDSAAVEASFIPLKADPTLVSQFRQAYKDGKDLPLIGIAWAALNETRMQHVPSIDAWAGFLRDFPATYVSLQYRLPGASVAQLEKASNVRVIDDDSVDQFLDLDRFAAQIASLDAVVTIAVTGADAAGALGVRCIEIVGDKPPASLPVIGCKTPWYPRTRIVRRQGRTWAAAFEEVGNRLKHAMPV